MLKKICGSHNKKDKLINNNNIKYLIFINNNFTSIHNFNINLKKKRDGLTGTIIYVKPLVIINTIN